MFLILWDIVLKSTKNVPRYFGTMDLGYFAYLKMRGYYKLKAKW